MVISVVNNSPQVNPPTRQRAEAAPAVVETTVAAASPARSFDESFSLTKGQVQADTGLYVVLMRDSVSGEVRVQIPNEKAASTYRKTQSITSSDQVSQATQGSDLESRQSSAVVAESNESGESKEKPAE